MCAKVFSARLKSFITLCLRISQMQFTFLIIVKGKKDGVLSLNFVHYISIYSVISVSFVRFI